MNPIKILGICGSLRRQSTNMGLLLEAQKIAPTGMKVDIANLSAIPLYNQDITEKTPAVQTLLDQFAQADALLLACPEYNYSVAPALKNALDWASRETNNRLLANKPAAVLGAGGGMGTSRAQYHLRQICVCLNLRLINRPEVFCNAFSGSFNPEGKLIDPAIKENLAQVLVALSGCLRKTA